MSIDLGGVYIPVGVNVGAALRRDGANGLLLGGEASFVRYYHRHRKGLYFGGYLDYLRDFGAGIHRISVGPEVGWLFGGLDAGPVVELGGGRTEFGARARVFASIAVVTIYAGELCRVTTAEARWTTEVGMLLKFPFGIASCGRGGCNWGQW
jgi:hypothetical protein